MSKITINGKTTEIDSNNFSIKSINGTNYFIKTQNVILPDGSADEMTAAMGECQKY